MVLVQEAEEQDSACTACPTYTAFHPTAFEHSVQPLSLQYGFLPFKIAHNMGNCPIQDYG